MEWVKFTNMTCILTWAGYVTFGRFSSFTGIAPGMWPITLAHTYTWQIINIIMVWHFQQRFDLFVSFPAITFLIYVSCQVVRVTIDMSGIWRISGITSHIFCKIGKWCYFKHCIICINNSDSVVALHCSHARLILDQHGMWPSVQIIFISVYVGFYGGTD